MTVTTKQDIQFIQGTLPYHYTVQESNTKGSIHCKSSTGIDENKSDWKYIMGMLKEYFKDRLQEVFHNTCHNHVDFTIYVKV